MRTGIWNFSGGRWPAWHRAVVAFALLFVACGWLGRTPALADGCFVFRWNKSIDINEPTQKAIIVHDAGREDLLLQVKYEGPLTEFGWLIPVPSLPTVEKGSMQPFYELSELTQRQWGDFSPAATLSPSAGGVQEEAVRVVEVKTVGAYRVTILSAQDTSSLQRWLKAHDYSVPEGKGGIIDEYVRKGWYFIAAKIDLAEPVSFQKVSITTTNDAELPAKERTETQRLLSRGELHPLLISFDSPQCIYPLRISAVGGKLSEVSLYVFSAEALLDQFIFDKSLEKLRERLVEEDWVAKQDEQVGRRSMQDRRFLHIAAMMYSVASPEENARGVARDWGLEDIEALARGSWPDALPDPMGEHSDTSPYDLAQWLRPRPEDISQCAKELPRLKGRNWYLTKQVWTFRPEEMHDLRFRPAISLAAAALQDRAGDAVAGFLREFGPAADSVLLAACQSTNALQRINASLVLSAVKDPRVGETLLRLFEDDVPEVRYNAVTATAGNWNARYIEPLIALLRDPHLQIRRQAAQSLRLHESTNRVPTYVAMLRDPDPEVQECALQVLSRFGRDAIPRADLLRLLGSSRLDRVSWARSLLQGSPSSDWTYPPPFLDPRFPGPRETNYLTSVEAAPLTTNRLTMARLMGLKILRQNADAQAVALTLPLLRDTNSIVRNRAFALLQSVTGQDIPQNDPARWEQWWSANKETFVVRKPTT